MVFGCAFELVGRHMISKSMLIIAFLEYLYLFLLVLKSQVMFLLAYPFYEEVQQSFFSFLDGRKYDGFL